MVNASVVLLAATFRFFGSAGAETQLTPANTDSPLNPRNVVGVPYQTNVADVSAFAEASAERWKVRLKVRGDASDRSTDRVRAGEAFVQLHVNDWLDITAGRVIEKWGTGYGWTPTAFIGPAKDPTDPNDRRSAYRGVDMIRADVSVKDTNLSLYALERGTYAARLYRLVRGTDVSLMWSAAVPAAEQAASRRGQGGEDAARSAGEDAGAPRFGISLSRVFGEALELHADVARDRGVLRGVAGGQYTFANDVNVVLELYYGGDGLSASEWESFQSLDIVSANRAYAPLRMGRAYAFARVHRSFREHDLDAELIAITNLRDGSTILRASLTRKVRPNVNVYLIHTEFAGSDRSELAYLQVARVTTAGVRLYF